MEFFMSKKPHLSHLFNEAIQKNNFNEFLEKSKPLLSSVNENDLKSIVELTIREVLVELCMGLKDITLLERVFQFSIDAALHDIVPGNVPVVVLGDMFDSSTIVECEKIFSFVESRVETFKKEIFFKACKNHLLRSCNDLLRRLSRSQNTVFCGRILMFLAHIFPLSERSGLNIVSEFNLENTTVYNTNDDMFSDLSSEKGDGPEEGEITSNQSQLVADKNLYQKFWSLQDFFRSPNTCYNKMQWRNFANCTSEILSVFANFKADNRSASKWKDVKLSQNNSCVYFAKYLTSPKLLELQLSDSHFRRYVLVQFLILFQYLTSPVKFKLESYILTDDQQTWVKDTTKQIYKLLEETPPDGTSFAHDVEKILQREEYWNAWKNEGCPDFKQVSEKIDLDKKPVKRPWDPHPYKCKASPEIINLWSATPNNWEACRSPQRNFVPSLETFFGMTPGKSDGISLNQKRGMNAKYQWKALRLLSMKSPHFFTANPSPAKNILEYLESVVQKIAKEKPQNQQDIMTVETAAAEDSIEDGNDEYLHASEDDCKDDEKIKKETAIPKAILEVLSARLQDRWQVLAVRLGFQEDEIQYFEEASPKSKLQAEQMLTVWMDRDGSVSSLVNALHSSGLSSLVSLLPNQE